MTTNQYILTTNKKLLFVEKKCFSLMTNEFIFVVNIYSNFSKSAIT